MAKMLFITFRNIRNFKIKYVKKYVDGTGGGSCILALVRKKVNDDGFAENDQNNSNVNDNDTKMTVEGTGSAK